MQVISGAEAGVAGFGGDPVELPSFDRHIGLAVLRARQGLLGFCI